MAFDFIFAQLTSQAQSIASLVRGVSDEQARWKPAQDAWSILEVINHLFDEEREDFRRHLQDALLHPDQPWHPIAPARWVSERGYNQRALQGSLDNFLREREQSLDWLQSLPPTDWQAEYNAPWGTIRAGDLLASWAAHDLLHLRQLVELRYAWTLRSAEPYSLQYAGDW